MVGRRGENFGVEKRWKKKKFRARRWDFRSSGKRPQRAHPQLVHWWLLIHSSQVIDTTSVLTAILYIKATMSVCLCGQCLENFPHRQTNRHCPGLAPHVAPPLWTNVVCFFYMDKERAANKHCPGLAPHAAPPLWTGNGRPAEGGGARAGKDRRVHYAPGSH